MPSTFERRFAPHAPDGGITSTARPIWREKCSRMRVSVKVPALATVRSREVGSPACGGGTCYRATRGYLKPRPKTATQQDSAAACLGSGSIRYRYRYQTRREVHPLVGTGICTVTEKQAHPPWGKHEFLPTGYLISRNRFCPITGYFLRNFLEISEFSPCPSRHVKYSFRTPSRTLTDTVSANATNKHLSQDAFIVSEHERSLMYYYR